MEQNRVSQLPGPDSKPRFFAEPPGSRPLRETVADSVRLYVEPVQKIVTRLRQIGKTIVF